MTQTPVACAQRALDFVEDGQTLGLGTGRAATAFVVELGRRVADGFRVRGVATSEATAAVAREWSIPLLELDEAGTLDVTIDGATIDSSRAILDEMASRMFETLTANVMDRHSHTNSSTNTSPENSCTNIHCSQIH